MNILILGAGEVGRTVASYLAKDNNDVTVIDTNQKKLDSLSDKNDISCIHTNAANPRVLSEILENKIDIAIAVTSEDETNLVACKIIKDICSDTFTVCRLRNGDYLDNESFKLSIKNSFYIDLIISPTGLITENIKDLIDNPGASEVLSFADGKIKIACMHIKRKSPLCNKSIKEIIDITPTNYLKTIVVFRKNIPIQLNSSTTLLKGDEIYFLVGENNGFKILPRNNQVDRDYKKIIIAGGGNLGFGLAKLLEREREVKLIERAAHKSNLVSQKLDNTIVIRGSATDRDLLYTEDIEETDIFCSLTNVDETNIMASVLAKRCHAHRTICLVKNLAYAEILDGGEIDIALSPHKITISSILADIRSKDIIKAFPIRKHEAEAIEVVAHGSFEDSNVIGRSILSLKLPSDIIFVCATNKNTLITDANHILEAKDSVVLLILNKDKIPYIEQLFKQKKA